jgi:ABC-type multidrug transport system ATPase subunit
MTPLLELKDVTFSYTARGPSVFAPVNLALSEAEAVGIAGDNGTGKSTLLKIAASLIRPTSGHLFFAGTELGQCLDQFRTVLNYTAGAPLGFYPRLTGVENLRFFSAMKGRTIDEASARKLMRRAGLPVSADEKKCHQYSLGMKQRLHLARLFLEPCKLLILDEPTNGLSPEGVSLLIALLNEDLKSKAKLIVSHDADFLARTTSRVLHLRALSKEADDRGSQ